MLILATTTDKIQVLLTSAVTTNQLDCIATYKDISTTAYSGSSPTLVTTNNTTAVDLVPAPASNVQRIVDFISVYNADTVNAIVTIRINRNGSTGVLFKCILSTNELLVYVEGKGWNIHSSSGLSKQSLLYDNSNITTNPTTGLPQWTTATRPVSPANGTQGFNRTRNRAEYYANGFWIDGYFGLNAGLAFTIASLGTIAVGSNPRGVAYSPSNDRIYVANNGSNNVSVINSTNTVVDTIVVGNNPVGVAYSPSNDRIYVANYTSNNVSILS